MAFSEDYRKKKKISKTMDYLPALFIQKDRISKFIRDMNHFSVRDIKKLEKLIDDFESDLAFYMGKLNDEEKKDLANVNAELGKLDVFDDPEIYVRKLIDKKRAIMSIIGTVGILPDYVAGMVRHRAE